MVLSTDSWDSDSSKLCQFCIDNVWGPDGWAEFGITEAALPLPDLKGYDEEGDSLHAFENNYNVDLVQLHASTMEGCWWCARLIDTISVQVKRLSGQGRYNILNPVSHSINLSIYGPRFFRPRRLGRLLVEIRRLGSCDFERCLYGVMECRVSARICELIFCGFANMPDS